MDLDGEWELVIPSSFSSSNSKSLELQSSFLGPDLFFEADYFKCPQKPTLLITHHHLQKQQQEQELPVEQVQKLEEELPVEEEAEEEEEEEEQKQPPSPYKDTSASLPAPAPAPALPFNWLEPDPVVFDCGPDRYHKEEAMPMGRNKELVEEDKDCSGFSLWQLGLHGIGAICSFGVATAATLCVFALGTASASASSRLRPSPNIQFQIYSDDKRIKDVVQRATGLNQAISAARGITIPRAQISFGGHYEGL